MNPVIEKHQCAIQILALIDLAELKIKTMEQKINYLPDAKSYYLHRIEITTMAIRRLKIRYLDLVIKLVETSPK